MTLSASDQAAAAFKVLFGKTPTQTANGLANEGISANVPTAAQQVFGQYISPLIADSTIVELITATLTLISTSNGLAYQAYYPAGHALAGQTVSAIVTDSFGSIYRPILQNNGVEVPPLDASDWYLTPSSGVVASRAALNLGTTGTLVCYRYKGQMVTDVLASLSTSVTTAQAGATYGCDDSVVVGNVVSINGSRHVGALDIRTNGEALGVVASVTGASGAKQAKILANDNEVAIGQTFSTATPGTRVFLKLDGTLDTAMPTNSGYRIWQVGVLTDATHLHVQLKMVKVVA